MRHRQRDFALCVVITRVHHDALSFIVAAGMMLTTTNTTSRSQGRILQRRKDILANLPTGPMTEVVNVGGVGGGGAGEVDFD
jgi:hypothetical protein